MKNMNKGKRYKNYCVCKIKGGILYRDPECFAKYIHNGKKTVVIHNMEAFYLESRYDRKTI